MSSLEEQRVDAAWAALEAKIERQLDKSGKCWIWTGYVNTSGFGVVYPDLYPCDMRKMHVHKMMYILKIGDPPKGSVVSHTCGNKLCCNPKHLIIVSRSDISANGKKTHCLRGHLLPEPKQYGERLERSCPECAKIRQAEYRKRKSEVLPFEK